MRVNDQIERVILVAGFFLKIHVYIIIYKDNKNLKSRNYRFI